VTGIVLTRVTRLSPLEWLAWDAAGVRYHLRDWFGRGTVYAWGTPGAPDGWVLVAEFAYEARPGHVMELAEFLAYTDIRTETTP
jgi:hypothetical protein